MVVIRNRYACKNDKSKQIGNDQSLLSYVVFE